MNKLSISQDPKSYDRFLERVYDTETGRLDPKLVASELKSDEQELADMAKVHRTTVQLTPQSKKLQNAMRDMMRVMKAAETLCGDMEKAVRWFRYQPLADFRYLTPIQLVQQGEVQAVIDYISSIEAGSAG